MNESPHKRDLKRDFSDVCDREFSGEETIGSLGLDSAIILDIFYTNGIQYQQVTSGGVMKNKANHDIRFVGHFYWNRGNKKIANHFYELAEAHTSKQLLNLMTINDAQRFADYN